MNGADRELGDRLAQALQRHGREPGDVLRDGLQRLRRLHPLGSKVLQLRPGRLKLLPELLVLSLEHAHLGLERLVLLQHADHPPEEPLAFTYPGQEVGGGSHGGEDSMSRGRRPAPKCLDSRADRR